MQCMMVPLPGVGGGGSVCISPVCSLESHVTFRGHGIFGEAAGVWSEGLEFFDHKASLLCISDISWPVWGLQDIVSMRNLPWNSCGFRDDCKHMSEIYFLLPPHLLSSCLFSGTLHLLPIRFFFPFPPLQAKSCSGGVMCETWPWSGSVLSTTTAG